MPKSAYHVAVDAIQATIRPWLQEQGFRVRGRAFNRVTDDGLTQVISIQMGPFEPPGTVEIPGLRENLHGLFTVNLGVYVPEIALHHWGGGAKAWVHESDCAIRARLGRVCTEARDLWWQAVAIPEVVEAIRERLSVYGLPWLQRFATRELVLRELHGLDRSHWVAAPRIAMAIIRWARGEAAEAHALLADQAAEAATSHRGHAEYVRELALRLGLGILDGKHAPVADGAGVPHSMNISRRV